MTYERPEKPTLEIFVQHVEPARSAWHRVLAALRASDARHCFRVQSYEAGDVRATTRRTFEAMRTSDADLVMRLEDDAMVGRHFLYNVTTWPLLWDDRFTVGWLFDPGGTCSDGAARRHLRYGKDQWVRPPWHASLGVVMWRASVPTVIEAMERFYAKHPGERLVDFAISHAAVRGIATHSPPLLENIGVQDSINGHFNHPKWHTSDSLFDPDWRRPPERPYKIVPAVHRTRNWPPQEMMQ